MPQIKLGVNGEIILDETSLVVDNVKEKEALNSIKKFDVVYDDEISGSNLTFLLHGELISLITIFFSFRFGLLQEAEKNKRLATARNHKVLSLSSYGWNRFLINAIVIPKPY